MNKSRKMETVEPDNRIRLVLWAAAVLLLLLPLLAMQVTDQVRWDFMDFAILAGLLAVMGGIGELVVRRTGDMFFRLGTAVALAAVFLLTLVNGAVGIIGSSHNDANLMFAGVILVAGIGVVAARFRAPGMVRAMIAAALAQTVVAVVALVAGAGSEGTIWPQDLLLASVFFAGMWLLASWLFRKAA